MWPTIVNYKSLKVLMLCLIVTIPLQSSEKQSFSIVIHGGAGWFSNLSDDEVQAIKDGLSNAIDVGFTALQSNQTSLDAVEKAIVVLENNDLFNAGKGSVYTSEEKQEMDASIMYGLNNQAGAVASVTNVKNPISLARHVMEKTKHVMFAGKGAERLALEAGIELVDPEYFYSEEKLRRLRDLKKEEKKMGTVGVVAIDVYGNMAAGTSTGGMTNKLPGRIGDAPIIGAGTWVENKVCGVSGTGHGEFFIRFNVAKEICDRVKYKNLSISEAANQVVDELQAIEADGGVIVLDGRGRHAFAFNTPAMARAFKSSDGKEFVEIYK